MNKELNQHIKIRNLIIHHNRYAFSYTIQTLQKLFRLTLLGVYRTRELVI